MNTDYAFNEVLLQTHEAIPIVDTYDINCHYNVNILKRFAENFERTPTHLTESKITWLIPKLHLQGHKTDCQYRFSMNYTPGTGRSYGELIEVGWNPDNRVSKHAQEMNNGHRQDTVTDSHGYANWEKAERLGK